MADLESSKSKGSGRATANPLEELEFYRQRVRELERLLAERERQVASYPREIYCLALAFQRAGIRAWYWAKGSRLTRYLPDKGDVRDSMGGVASEIPFPEERLLQSVHPDDRERLADVWDQANKDHLPYEIEYRFVLTGDEVRHQWEIGSPEFDKAGRYLGHFGTTQDITERKLAEEAREASEARLAGILDIAPEAVVSVNSDQRIQLYNKGAEIIFGYAADEVLGQPLDMLLPARFREAHARQIENFARSPQSRLLLNDRRAIFALRKNGSEFAAEASVSRFEQDGEMVFTVMLHDISERKRAEEALLASEHALQERVADLEEAQRKLERQGEDLVQLADDLKVARDHAELASRAKSEFLANMSHELRTPLNAIIGFSEIIKTATFGPVGSPKYREYAKDINDSGQHLLHVITDILDISKIEAGKLDLDEEVVDVPKVVESCLKLVNERARNAGLALVSEIADDPPPLRADARKLKQILLNLLSNAIKFTPAGGTVTTRVWCRRDDGYVFQVADTGIGIAPDDIARVLAPFGQVDGTLARRFEGTGLGLSLTKSLVEMHGGSFDLQSEPGAGTTVTARFPAGRIVSEAAASKGLPSASTGPSATQQSRA